MPRIRSVHPDICQSETMARLPASLERTFVRLWTHCDDEGRCEDRPKILKASLYPEHDDITAISLDEELTKLDEQGLIQRYVVDGKRLIQVVSWNEYQKPQKPKPSKYAAPTGYLLSADESPPDPDDSPLEDDAAGVGVGEGDGIGEGGGGTEGDSADKPPRRRLNIEKAHWKPTLEQLEWAADEFPDVDLTTETEKFIDHFTANGKPMKDWDAAWRNWMRRAPTFARADR